MLRLFVSLAAGLLAACSAPSAGAGPETAIRAPMALESGRPVVEMTLNGEGPYRIILDTGTGGDLLINEALAGALSLRPRGETEIRSPMGGAPAHARVYRMETVSLGGFTAEDVRTRALTAGDLMTPGADGVVGPSLFAGAVVEMDFRRGGELRVLDRPSVDVPEGAWLPLGPAAPLLEAELRLAGQGFPALIDTGNSAILVMPEETAARLPLARAPRPVGEGRTVDRVFQVAEAPVSTRARLSGAEIPLRSVHFAPVPLANLGTGGVRGTVLVMDWPNGRYALIGRAAPVQPSSDQ